MKLDFFTNMENTVEKFLEPQYNNLFDIDLFTNNSKINDEIFIELLNESVVSVDLELKKYRFHTEICLNEGTKYILELFHNLKHRFPNPKVTLSLFNRIHEPSISIDFTEVQLDDIEFLKFDYNDNSLTRLNLVWGFRKYKLRLHND
jgi:hypothetical protein